MHPYRKRSRKTIIVDTAGRVARLIVAVAVVGILFSILPLVHGMFTLQPQSIEEKAMRAPVVMQKRSEEPKKEKSSRSQRTLRSTGKAGSARDLALTMRFTPDLGVGEGHGVGVAGAGVGTTVFDEGDVDQPPRPLKRTAVSYPRRAKEAGIEGTVSLVLVIDRNGLVEDITVTASPSPLFDNDVKRTVKDWRFVPAENGGVRVRVRMKQDITFELDG